MRRLIAVAILALLAGCATSGPKEIRVTVTEKGFEPEHVVIARGQPAVLVITRKTERTCATEVVFAETAKKYDLPMNTPVRVDLANADPGTLHYACAMNMFKGTVTIE